ncbi:hypothetical protein, partial [Streptomyces chryseus]|uniref:hypothetical protein n=1 Tax=Streptomyces chryseus TaxID=68186 RepID=UPI003F6FBE4E
MVAPAARGRSGYAGTAAAAALGDAGPGEVRGAPPTQPGARVCVVREDRAAGGVGGHGAAPDPVRAGGVVERDPGREGPAG